MTAAITLGCRRRPRRRAVIRRHEAGLRDARAARSRAPTRRTSRPGTSGNTTRRRRCCGVIIRRTSSPRKATTLRPHYLPDGRIVFSSTRQRQSKAILLDEGKPQFAAQDERPQRTRVRAARHERGRRGHPPDLVQPEPRPRSRRCWTTAGSCSRRWDNAAGHNEISLYTMRPGRHATRSCCTARSSHDTGTDDSDVQFLDPRPSWPTAGCSRARSRSQRRISAAICSRSTPRNYVENTQPTLAQPRRPDGPGAGSGHDQRRAHRSTGPRRAAATARRFPLHDGTGRLLVSWTQCRVLGRHAASCRAPPSCLAPADGRAGAAALRHLDLRPGAAHATAGRRARWKASMFTDVVALQPRALPPVLLDRDRRRRLRSPSSRPKASGILDIRSVYDIDGTDTAPGGIAVLRDPGADDAAQRPARFLRVEKAGRHARRRRARLRQQRVRRDVGVRHARDPRLRAGRARRLGAHQGAGQRAFAITVLDANGRRIGPRHRQLAAAARRRGVEVQRLSRRRARRVARPRRACSPP